MLTDRTIKSAAETVRAGGREVVLSDDTGTRGTGRLMLRLRPRGDDRPSGEWFARWKRQGQRAQVQLGRWPDMPLAEARRRYEAHRGAISAGEDPKAQASAGTVEDLFAVYVAAARAAGRTAYAAEVERALLTSKAGPIADEIGRTKPAKDVTPGDIADALAPVFRRAPAMAGHLRAYLAAAWNHGIRHDHDFTAARRTVRFGIASNPVAMLRTVPAKPRTRVLSPEEMRAWWRTFPDYADERTALVLRLTLCCCARVTEAIRLRPRDVEPGRWTKARTKNGKPHAAPLWKLSQPMALRLAELGGGDMTIPAVSKAVRRWCEATEAPLWQPRDLRRTARTMLEEAGEDPSLLDLAFNHQTVRGGVSRNYNHAERWQARVALAQRWETMLARAVGEPLDLGVDNIRSGDA